MQSSLESPEWLAAVGAAIAARDAAGRAAALVEAIGAVVMHEGTCLLAFYRDAGPEVLHHSLEPEGRRHYLDRYLAGPYLLDPLYQLALGQEKPSLCRFRDAVPDRFRSSEYYRQYCERTHLLDEMDFLADVAEDTTVALVVGRRTRMFTRSELQRLAQIEPVVQAAMRRIWLDHAERRRGPRGEAMHRRLTECFERFGESMLTERERQISQLLLKGHSSKSVARELGIAPGTVMVHKRNLFAKLGISSQYELFSRFIGELGAG
ncbi:MAG: helix-turn-helix transcriptional regulator [Gammaproteobacteria bacterium]|nr:helix-turn-helix transcriptional regulator [Gammaproteobacteria bacterium]MDH4254710.1 helix-turn-helix transcriptional regulator [Gammaproteobacteria bacterium]MDH5308813.1 helix-turn-helix transcriptional regulator [Gammaproteobacteria bacterium]